MIGTNEDGTNVLEFGTGDIEVTNGFTSDKASSCVAFIQQKPSKIGDKAQSYEKYGDDFVIRSDSHTLFTFTNAKSIDVIIEHLNAAKSTLLDIQQNKQ